MSTVKQIALWVVLLIGLLGCTTTTPTDTEEPDTTPPDTTEPDPTEPDPTELSRLDVLVENLEAWGLGSELITYVSNDHDEWEWYVDQVDTGRHYHVNCGPASIEMIGRWLDEDFDGSAEELRAEFRPEGGWWYGNDIVGAFDMYDIAYNTYDIEHAGHLTYLLDEGYLLLINNNMTYIPLQEEDGYRTNKHYTVQITGHYMIVHGYVETDEGLFFEVNDPYGMRARNDDGSPRAMNRFFEADALLESMLNWWPGVHAIPPDQNP